MNHIAELAKKQCEYRNLLAKEREEELELTLKKRGVLK